MGGSTTIKHFCFHWLTNQDGHLLNYLRQGNIVQGDFQYTVAHPLDLYLEMDMTFSFQTTHHPIAILRATLAGLTAHRAGTATQAPSL